MSKIHISFDELSYHTNEAIKTLRSNLTFCREDRKVIIVTSSIAGEGKSSISLDLAKSLAQINKKVLLIDADIRKSVFVNRLKTDEQIKGLSHYLSGQGTASEIVHSTNVNFLHAVVSGPTVSNTTELLSGERFDKLIERCRNIFDYVIIDAAPIGLVIDAAIIGERCDGAIYVIESGAIKYSFVQSCIRQFKSSGTPILGVVINKVNHKKDKKYYSKYYSKYH